MLNNSIKFSPKWQKFVKSGRSDKNHLYLGSISRQYLNSINLRLPSITWQPTYLLKRAPLQSTTTTLARWIPANFDVGEFQLILSVWCRTNERKKERTNNRMKSKAEQTTDNTLLYFFTSSAKHELGLLHGEGVHSNHRNFPSKISFPGLPGILLGDPSYPSSAKIT